MEDTAPEQVVVSWWEHQPVGRAHAGAGGKREREDLEERNRDVLPTAPVLLSWGGGVRVKG